MHIWKNGVKIDSVQVTNDLNLTFSTNQQVINPELEVEMVTVEGGTFMMGAQDIATPVHSVTLSPFKIAKYEITQKLWVAVMGTNPSYFTGDENRPVENVSWNDVQQFITNLNQLTGKNYRLPTEAEWEYAARGGNQSQGYTYSGWNYLNPIAWYSDNSGSTTHPVGAKEPNELGLYDMSGNVYEWCNDWFGDYGADPVIDPQGSSIGLYRVFRGGSWFSFSNDNSCRPTSRQKALPGNINDKIGARLVLGL